MRTATGLHTIGGQEQSFEARIATAQFLCEIFGYVRRWVITALTERIRKLNPWVAFVGLIVTIIGVLVSTVALVHGMGDRIEARVQEGIKDQISQIEDSINSTFASIEERMERWAPYPYANIGNREIAVGDIAVIGLESYFIDPNGEIVSYGAGYTPGTFEVEFPNDNQPGFMRIRGLKPGRAKLTTHAHDDNGNIGRLSLWVTVVE